MIWHFLLVLQLAGLFALADAQTSASSASTLELPQCAIRCFAAAPPASACVSTNLTCICESAAFNQYMASCVEQQCPIIDALVTLNATRTSCHRPIRDRSGEYSTISITLVVFAALFILQRFAYKLYAGIELGLDDWFTLATLLFGIPGSIINGLFLPANGIGRDVWTLTPEQITNFGRFFFATEVIYFTAIWLAKLALLFFYRRIFPGMQVRRLLDVTIVVNLLFGFAFSLVAIFQCTPINYFWLRWDGLHKGHCVDINALSWSNAIISIVLDFWMLGIPLWQLRILTLGWKKKLGVGMMFAAGTFVTVVSILRLKSLVTFRYTTTNPTYDFFEVGVWSDAEINASLICVCLPSLRLLLMHVFPRIRESVGHDSHGGKNLGERDDKYAKLAMRHNNYQASDGESGITKADRVWLPRPFTVKYIDHDEVQLVSLPAQKSGIKGGGQNEAV